MSSTTPIPAPPLRPALRPALQLAAAFTLARLLLQFALTLWSTHIGYSYFRDEFYFIACGRHLAWGYVDQGPLVALTARSGELLFGDSVFAIRIVPALAGALTVGLTGLLTWALGGHRSAQALAMLALLLTPVFLGTAGTLCIPALEPIFWMGALLCLLLLQRGGNPRILWPAVGVLAGVGLLNKPSMVFFLAAMLLAVLLTPERRLLHTRWFGVATLLTLCLVAPFLLWEARNSWPTWEFLRNGQLRHKTVLLGPLAFLTAQIFQLNPVNTLLWIPGLVACLRPRTLPGARWIGLTFLLFLALMYALHAKDYYLAPIYPVLFAAGAVAWEARSRRRQPANRPRPLFAIPVLGSVLVLAGLLILPMASPVLEPATWVRYTHALHLVPNESENAKASILPQFFADRFGWDQLTQVVVDSYRALPAADRRHVCIFANNYGEAGSIDFLGRRAEPALPPVISGQNTYWLWGTRGCSGDPLIAVVHDTPEQLLRKYTSVTILGTMSDPLAMGYEHKHIYLLRNRRPDAPIDWPAEKDYI